MKKLYLLFALLFSLNLKAQTYTPLVQDSLVWQVMYASMDDPWIPTFFYYHSNFYTRGDTIINNLTYYKLYECYSMPTFPDCGSQTGIPFGYLRENNKQVFFKKDVNSYLGFYFWIGDNGTPNDTIEKLIYDFNWNPGDTIIDTVADGNHYYKLIEDTSTITINQEQLKEYTVNSNFFCSGGEKIIERMGSLMGFFELYARCFENGSCLKYFTDLKTGFFYSSTAPGCYGVVVNEILVQNGLYAYAANKTIYIKKTLPGNYTYNLYNVSGSLVQSGNVTGNELQITSPSGIYFLHTVNSNGVVKTFKLGLFE